MSSDLFEQQRLGDLQRATQTYEDAKQNYQRLVRLALKEQDSKKRSDLYDAITTENGRLIGVVQQLMTAWSQGANQTNDDAQEQVVNLDKELQEFRQNMQRFQDKQDSVVQLQNVLSSVSGQSDTNKTYYYGYIVAVLVMLVVVFMLFIFSYYKIGSSAESALTLNPTTPTPVV
uniref:Uncharacterized protein n=1 Tax=viral metagenome TaxID=1070528 RepID=A0A6C0I5X7_9ZZZZ